MNPDEAFAEVVRKNREAQGWSQADLAQRVNARGLNFTATTIYKIEHSKRRVTVGELVVVLDALRLSVHELFPRSDEMFIVKEALQESGMEALLAVEKAAEFFAVAAHRQQAIRRVLEEYRANHDGADPIWFGYRPGGQNMAEEWEPLAEWDGFTKFVDAWLELNAKVGDEYIRALGWAEDWLGASIRDGQRQFDESLTRDPVAMQDAEDDLRWGIDAIEHGDLTTERWWAFGSRASESTFQKLVLERFKLEEADVQHPEAS